MDVQKYLDRIRYHGSLEPNLQTLSGLQQTHMIEVPFENLSIHYNQPITLKEKLLFQKIVDRKRGGFCYELNGLFAWLLRELGFSASMLSAGVITSEGSFGPEFDHMTLLVHLEEDYLVDVGFGNTFQKPLLFKERGEQNQGGTSYQIAQDGDSFILMEQNNRDEKPSMQAQYRFNLKAHELNEYEKMCHYHQTSPESHFTQKRICSRATPDGRITVSDLRLIVTWNNAREEIDLTSEQEYLEALKEYFEIVL